MRKRESIGGWIDGIHREAANMGRGEGSALLITLLAEDAGMHERPVHNEVRTGRFVPDVRRFDYIIRASGTEA